MLENPLQRSDNHFLDELVRKQQASQDGKPRQGALYFVSFSIPEEGLKRMLGREKPDHQLKAWAEKQVLENPLQRSDNHFLDELVRKQQASQDGKPRQGALYFVSFSIPEEGLKRMLGETRHYGIPATLRGMVNNDLKTTAEAVSVNGAPY